jgi:hypothetical protein
LLNREPDFADVAVKTLARLAGPEALGTDRRANAHHSPANHLAAQSVDRDACVHSHGNLRRIDFVDEGARTKLASVGQHDGRLDRMRTGEFSQSNANA